MRISWLFVSLGIPPKIRFGSQNGGNTPTKIWLRYKIFQKFTLLWVLQNLMFWKNTVRVLMRVSLAGFTRCFRLIVWQKPQACRNSVWDAGISSASAKIALMVLKAYTGFSDRQLVEHLNGNIHYQMFCGIMIDPSFPITNYKIVSAIRNEMASRLDIESLQEVLASHWKPYLENLHVCMTDATCYESHMRFPTDMKLLWESLEWLYRHICKHCGELGIRRPRNKYRNVAESYLSYCKKRKRKASKTRMLKRRMIRLLEKLLIQRDEIHRKYGASLRYTRNYRKRLSIIRKIFVQEKEMFEGRKVSDRIVSIDRHLCTSNSKRKGNKVC